MSEEKKFLDGVGLKYYHDVQVKAVYETKENAQLKYNEIQYELDKKADKIHTHNWEDKPFGTSGEAIESGVLYELTYDSEVTKTSWSIGEYFLGMSITNVRLYLDDEAYDFVQTSATPVVQKYSNSDGMTISSYLVDWYTKFDLGEEKTFTTLKVVKIEESVNKMPIEYLPEHTHTIIDIEELSDTLESLETVVSSKANAADVAYMDVEDNVNIGYTENNAGCSWNDITDKPFEDNTVVYYERRDGYEPLDTFADNGSVLYKVSDVPLSADELCDTVVDFYMNYEDRTLTITTADIEDIGAFCVVCDGMVLSVFEANDTLPFGRGLWLVGEGTDYVSKIYKESIKKMDSKYVNLYTRLYGMGSNLFHDKACEHGVTKAELDKIISNGLVMVQDYETYNWSLAIGYLSHPDNDYSSIDVMVEGVSRTYDTIEREGK